MTDTGREVAAASTSATGAGYRGPLLQTLQRGIEVLFHIADSPAPLTARAVSEHFGIDRTIAHRILRTLEADRLITSRSGHYSVGARVALLGQSYLGQLALREVSMPFQVDLLYRTFEGKPWSLSLSIMVENQLLIIDQLWAPSAPLNSIMSIGTRFPIDHTSAGRAMLAYLSPEVLAEILGSEEAEREAERFARIREAGGVDHAVNEAHTPPGIVALGAAIRNRAGEPVAGLSLSGPGVEDYFDAYSDVAVQLRRTAEQIGRSQ